MSSSDSIQPIVLQAGPLTLAFDRGELRWLRLGDREVLRGIYAAVRSPDWSTVPGVLENVTVDSSPGGFRVRFDAVHRADPVRFEWKGRLDGTPDGRVRFELDGVARSTFLRNRIGLCVLHPVEECAGAPCSLETTDGAVTPGVFPRLVSPHQPFFDLRAIRHEVVPGIEAEVRFEGEVFEMEDQRNWSDASFKTYSTPLALPLPVEVREGERIKQVATLTLLGGLETERERPAPVCCGWVSDDPVGVSVDPDESCPMPRLGHGLGTAEATPETIDRVRSLAPAHLRVDLRVSERTWRQQLATAAEVARASETRLEVAAFVSAAAPAEQLAELAQAARTLGAPLDAWLVFDADTRTTPPDLAAQARERLVTSSSNRPSPTLGGGTDGFFAELNRERIAVSGLDLVCLSLNPQVHAFDDATLVENTTSLGWMAETARSFAGETPLALSPVTLAPRPAADPRQDTLFAAGWTLGLIGAAAQAGFGRMTLFEIQGPGGVMEHGRLFPLGCVLTELAALASSSPDARIVRARPSDRSRCLTLAVEAGRLLRLYVFNPTPRSLDVAVSGLPPDVWQRSFRGAGAGVAPGEVTAQRLTAREGSHVLRLDAHDIVALDAGREAS